MIMTGTILTIIVSDNIMVMKYTSSVLVGFLNVNFERKFSSNK